MPETLRRVSIASRLWLAAHGPSSPMAVQLLCEGAGVLDAPRWRRAAAEASSANPGARLVLRGFLGSCRWVDSGCAPPVREVDGCPWDGMSQEGAEFLDGAFSPHAGPMAEVVLVHGSPSRVVFRAHHAIMDGRGCQTWAENIFRALRGEPVVSSDDAAVEDDLLNLAPGNPSNAARLLFGAPSGRASGSAPGTSWRRIRVEGRFPRLLPQVALLTAQEAWRHRRGSARVGIPVDLRARRPGLASTGNLTNMIFMDIRPGDTPEAITFAILKKLRNREDGMRTIEERLLPRIPLKVLRRLLKNDAQKSHRRGTYRCTGIISNLGGLSIDAYRGGGFVSESVCALPVCLGSFPFSMAMTGTRGKTDLVLSMPNMLAADRRLENILMHIAGGLESAGGSAHVAGAESP